LSGKKVWGNDGKDFVKFSFLDGLKEMFWTPWDSGQGFSSIAQGLSFAAAKKVEIHLLFISEQINT
jgi:hypothetical protein